MKVDTVRMMTMAALMAAAMSTTAFAGSWRTDGGGRWYQNDDGSCTKNGWQWIDSDNDGYSECFYFDSNGYVLTNTRTPDGSQVNGIGAWVKDGHVQSQAGGSGSSGGNSAPRGTVPSGEILPEQEEAPMTTGAGFSIMNMILTGMRTIRSCQRERKPDIITQLCTRITVSEQRSAGTR